MITLSKNMKKATLCYVDTDNFIAGIKTERYLRRLCERWWNKIWYLKLWKRQTITEQKRKNKKVIGLMKDNLGRKIMKETAALTAIAYSYLIDNDDEDKWEKSKHRCVIERKLKFQDHKSSLEATQLENEIKQSEKNEFNTKSPRENHKTYNKQ